MLLYLHSADTSSTGFRPESFAFVPQLLFSCLLIPFVVAKKNLATSMMAQTYAFVTFNKVCTSQVSLPPPNVAAYRYFLPVTLCEARAITNGATLSDKYPRSSTSSGT